MQPPVVLAAASVAAHDLRTAVLVVLAVLFILFRLLRRHQVVAAPLVIVPIVLGYYGLSDLRAEKAGLLVALLATCLIIEFGIGLLLGRSYAMWREADGKPWMQGTKLTVALWVLAFAVRVAFVVIERVTGAGVTESAEILLSIAAAFTAQSIVIARRAGLYPTFGREPPPPGTERL